MAAGGACLCAHLPYARRLTMFDHLMAAIDEQSIRATVTHLARPQAGGGHVIERAAILATGPDAAIIEAWILAHDGAAEQVPSTHARGGLHSHRDEALRPSDRSPRRYLLPPGALESAPQGPNN